MNKDDHQKLQKLFLHARRLDKEERRNLLDEVSAKESPQLRDDLEAMLVEEERLKRSQAETVEEIRTTSVTVPMSPVPQQVEPRSVGPYKILERLGEGGMGTVYLAEQDRPSRRVALKVIKWGMDTKAVMARFEVEREALALMDHPNIAKVFDAGSTQEGRPYFVMEYVKGVPITEHCDRQRLTNRQRLGLFLQVCEGVQHAHQKAVIHRDIKPSNILVTLQDGRAVPKLIDFGVAKATAARLTERTVFTELGQLVGTPEYMSPEQAEMSAQDIDTRTDVYSLGVLLYELLTGALPFESRELRAVGFDEIRRRIREDEPSKPSTRISTHAGAFTDSASRRRTDPKSLARQLRGDLDWITLKTLDKDRVRRYGSPNELVADIRRYLADEPVLAGPPSSVYRLMKFVRRHRAAVAVGVLLGLAVWIGLAGLAFGIGERSYQGRMESREAALVGMWESLDVGHLRASDGLLTSMTAALVSSYELGSETQITESLEEHTIAARSEFSDVPRMLAWYLDTVGRLHVRLGNLDRSESLLNEAHSLRSETFGDDHYLVGLSLQSMAELQRARGNETAAIELDSRAAEILRKHRMPRLYIDPSDPKYEGLLREGLKLLPR